jgi:hypothetical protein
VAGADDAADLAKQPADTQEQPLTLDRVLLHHFALLLSQRPRLVDDRLRDAHLADVVEQSRELGVPPLTCAEPQLVRNAKRQLDDVPAVDAGVGVVGLDHVTEEEGRAAVGVAQLELVIDPHAPLSREYGQQRDEWQREHDAVRGRVRRERDGEPDRSERRVDRVDPDHRA